MLLAYAGRPDEEPSSPIAVVCERLDIAGTNPSLFVKDGWEQKVSENHRSYIDDSFNDWLRIMEDNAGVLPPQILELSVGPFRTVAVGECDEQELTERVESFLMGPYRRLT